MGEEGGVVVGVGALKLIDSSRTQKGFWEQNEGVGFDNLQED